jgi:predicted DCC family thiol-disulfide oxidoreductase YuxK
VKSCGDNSDDTALLIVYDGLCPFCTRYVQFCRIRETVSEVKLIDARSGGDAVKDIASRGLALDDGMVVKWRGKYYFGSDALHILAILGPANSILMRANKAIFSRPRLARTIYPALVWCRRLTLRVLGRPLIRCGMHSHPI